MVWVKSEKGVTLLEVLLSLTILSIILLSVMSIFPQMGLMNKHNEDKAQAINTAKQVLNEWKVDEDVIAFLKNSYPWPADKSTTYMGVMGDFHYFEGSYNNFNLEIKIKSTTDSNPGQPANAHQIHVDILNSRNITISETYGYVIVD